MVEGSVKSLHQAESASVEEEEECHILPIPNLVAPVGDVVPILVASQETLNSIEHHMEIHHHQDRWMDYESGRSPDFSESPSSLHGFQSPKGSLASNDLSHPINVEGPLSDDLIMRLKTGDEVKAIECCNSSARLLENEAIQESADFTGTENNNLSANLQLDDLGYTSPEVPLCDEDGLVMWMDPKSSVKYTSKYVIHKPKCHRSSRNRTLDPQAVLQRLSSLGSETSRHQFPDSNDSSRTSSQVTPDEVSSSSMTPRSWKVNDETISETSSILKMSIKSLTNMSKDFNECIKNDEEGHWGEASRSSSNSRLGRNISTDDPIEHQYNDLSCDSEVSSVGHAYFSDANIPVDEATNLDQAESKIIATGFANPMSEAFEDFVGSPNCVGSPHDCSSIGDSNVVMDTHGTQTVIYQSNIQHGQVNPVL